jgi:hypothetical protein
MYLLMLIYSTPGKHAQVEISELRDRERETERQREIGPHLCWDQCVIQNRYALAEATLWLRGGHNGTPDQFTGSAW